jgi:signal transduction histidine kinase/phage shock protein PspC (stress-responsive transcriptional regulator)
MQSRVVAGVAGGIAEHLDVPVSVVRVVFAVLAGSGIGFLAYIALWVLVPANVAGPYPLVAPRGPQRRAQIRTLVAYTVVTMVACGVLGVFGSPLGGGTLGPLTLAGVGALLIWRRTSADQRERWTSDARRYGSVLGARRDWIIAGGGMLLVLGGVASFLAAHDALAQARAGALGIIAVLGGVLLVAGPWLLRVTRDLRAERRERIREQERAAVAAHVHDSVLQTLALLQARAADPAAVRRLARQQERDLRDWLYGAGATAGRSDGDPVSFTRRLRTSCAEVEDDFGVEVEVVTVGDTALDAAAATADDDRLTALLGAMRESIVNAAKHSGANAISVYAEGEPDQVSVWVRDRGKGFDPDTVPEDRRGLRDSVRGRMQRAGGTAQIRTSPGGGTEVELSLPWTAR